MKYVLLNITKKFNVTDSYGIGMAKLKLAETQSDLVTNQTSVKDIANKKVMVLGIQHQYHKTVSKKF